MSLKFNIDRPNVGDEEIKKQQDFKKLVEKFKQQSLKKAQGDESWWKDKKVRYSTVILGITVVCTVTYLSLFNNQQTKNTLNVNKTTLSTTAKKTNTSNQTRHVQAPSDKLKNKAARYVVNNAHGANLTHPSSTKISIPKNSFVDKHGKNIIGDVTIEYKEFQDVGDIIAEGIPMEYDSAGKKHVLETAGMFDIRGYQNGEPVFIAPEKNVKVELASANPEERFNQYYLDTVKRNWNYLKHDSPLPLQKTEQEHVAASKKLAALQHDIQVVLPRKIDSVGTVYDHKVAALPKTKEPVKPNKPSASRPNFKLDGSYEEFPELAAFENVLFEVGTENKNYTPELHEITWSDVRISQGPVKGVNYILNLSYRGRNENLVVYPVFTGAEFDKAMKSYSKKFENYELLIEKRNAEEKRLLTEMAQKQAAYLAEQKKKQEAYDKEKVLMAQKYNTTEQIEVASYFNSMSNQMKVQRVFFVSQFGIYNSDCPHNLPQGKAVHPVLVDAGNNKLFKPDFIYLVDYGKKTVYTLSKINHYQMRYDPNQTYSLCVFKNGQLYVCPKQKFKESADTDSNRFSLSLMKDASSNMIDFKKALEL